jgi:hypothetical protein
MKAPQLIAVHVYMLAYFSLPKTLFHFKRLKQLFKQNRGTLIWPKGSGFSGKNKTR